MSERGEVEVLMPAPTYHLMPGQKQALLRQAFEKAQELVAGVGGRVLGVTRVARAVHAQTGEQAVRLTFAVDAPEHVWHHRKSFPVS